MKILIVIVLNIALLASWTNSIADSHTKALRCDIGPAIKQFGGSQWLVYACNDNKSIVVVSAPGNPAMPFYFSFQIMNVEYKLNGEGSGSKDASNAAFIELQKLSKDEILKLLNEARNA